MQKKPFPFKSYLTMLVAGVVFFAGILSNHDIPIMLDGCFIAIIAVFVSVNEGR